MDIKKTENFILNPKEDPDKRKKAFDQYISSLPENHLPFIKKVSTCDSSILRFRARKVLDNPQPTKKSSNSTPIKVPDSTLNNSTLNNSTLNKIIGSTINKSTVSASDKITGSTANISSGSTQERSPNSAGPQQGNENSDKPAKSTISESALKIKPESALKSRITDKPKKSGVTGATASGVTGASVSGLASSVLAYSKILVKCAFAIAVVIAVIYTGLILKEKKNQLLTPLQTKPDTAAVTPDIKDIPDDHNKRLSPEKLLARAKEKFSEKNFQDARDLLEEALIAGKETAVSQNILNEIYFFQTKTFIELNDFNKAFSAIQNYSGKEKETYFLKAKIDFNRNNFEQALKNLKNYLFLVNNDFPALILAYDCSQLINSKEDSDKYLQELIANHASQIEAVLRIAEYDLNQKNFARLIDLTEPFSGSGGLYPMIYFYRAIAFKALKQAKKAILNYELYTRYSGKELPADTMYEIAVLCSSINNVNRAFYYYRLAAEKNGEILMRPDKGILDAARNRFETLFSLTSDDPHIISELAWIEYLSGNLERAKKLFLMLKETGRADVHVSAAQTMLQRLNNIDITSSTALAAADPKTADQATAADQTKAPIKEKPDAPRIIRNTGLAGETVKITEVTEKNQISNADLVTSDRHYENAEILLENKEYDRAFDEYEACLDLNPYNSEAALKIARLCHNKLKNTDDAVYFYKKYLALNSRDQSAYISISEILINEKNYDQALLWVNSAIQADPESEQIGYCNNLKNLVERRIAQAE